jgi:hypothetical protein
MGESNDETKRFLEGRRRREAMGIVLVALGIALFVMQFVDGPKESVILLAIGGAFLVAYVSQRSYGMLVPGCILIGLGLGRIVEWTSSGYEDYSKIGLGVGFVGIYALERFFSARSHWWPLIPGLILIVSGIAEGHRFYNRVVERGWPLILVVLGVLFLTGTFKSSRKSRE